MKPRLLNRAMRLVAQERSRAIFAAHGLMDHFDNRKESKVAITARIERNMLGS